MAHTPHNKKSEKHQKNHRGKNHAAGVEEVYVEVTLTPDALMPTYAHTGDAGMDLHSTITTTLPAGARALIPTGVSMAIPVGYVGLIHPRSGMSLKTGVTVANAPGTIDSGYRGEVGVIALNINRDEDITIHAGDRIAQLVIQKYTHAHLVLTNQLDDTVRGAGGYGSSGTGQHTKNTGKKIGKKTGSKKTGSKKTGSKKTGKPASSKTASSKKASSKKTSGKTATQVGKKQLQP